MPVPQNKKVLLIVVVLYLSCCIASYYYYTKKVGQFKLSVIQQLETNITSKDFQACLRPLARLSNKKNMEMDEWVLLVKALLDGNASLISGMVHNKVSDMGNIESIFITDTSGKILDHTDANQIGTRFKDDGGVAIGTAANGAAVKAELSARGPVLIKCSSGISIRNGNRLGTVHVIMNSDIENPLPHYRRTVMIWILIIFPIIFLSLFILINRFAKRKPKTPISPPKTVLTPVKEYGPYVFREKIAQGGMAELFIADHTREDGFKKTVAIKSVLPHLSENDEYIEIFMREAQKAAKLQHPNIVQILDYRRDERQNICFIVMEYIRGKNLAEIMKSLIKLDRGFRVDEATYIASQVAKGLEYSHNLVDEETGETMSLVHRDISPQNILISYQGEVKISDFGIAKASTDPNLTQFGVIKGKLGYLSPEQVSAEQRLDHRSDIYSLGIIFYELLTGKRLFKFANEIEAINKIPNVTIPPVMETVPHATEELNRIVMKCLEKDQQNRYQSARELFDDLAEFKNSETMSFDMESLSKFMNQFFQ